MFLYVAVCVPQHAVGLTVPMFSRASVRGIELVSAELLFIHALTKHVHRQTALPWETASAIWRKHRSYLSTRTFPWEHPAAARRRPVHPASIVVVVHGQNAPDGGRVFAL